MKAPATEPEVAKPSAQQPSAAAARLFEDLLHGFFLLRRRMMERQLGWEQQDEHRRAEAEEQDAIERRLPRCATCAHFEFRHAQDERANGCTTILRFTIHDEPIRLVRHYCGCKHFVAPPLPCWLRWLQWLAWPLRRWRAWRAACVLPAARLLKE